MLESGSRGLAAVPSGASTGEFEAVELRDGGERLGRQGRLAGGRQRQRRDRGGADRRPRRRAGRARPDDDRARRHAEQGPARRQRAARRLAGGGARRRRPTPGSRSSATSPSSTAAASQPAAGADDERPQRRRARRQLGRLPGVHDRPRSARQLLRRLRVGAEVFHALKKALQAKGLDTAVGDEGGFAPNLESNEAALQAVIDGIEAAGYAAGNDVFIALDPATSEFYEDGAYVLEQRGPHASAPRRWPPTGRRSATRYPIVSLEDGMAEDDWDGWKPLTESARRARPARRRRPLRHQPRAPAPRHRARRRQLDPGQGQPDRHADRDARRDRDRPRGGLHAR